MKRLLCVVLLILVSQPLAMASLSPTKTIVRTAKIDSRLRSAFLLRAIGSPQEYRQANSASLRVQLQTHFDAVLEILEANRERSLEVALARLEQRQGIRWSQSQRQYWHAFLSHQRDQNIERLAAYRDRGLFPLNEGHADGGVPIFVDNHDTACAVGHLMSESGWEREVELIAATNLLVYVTDASSGPLVNWVLQSGLTLGEATLIQPAYAPPLAEIMLDTLSGTGAGFNAPATFFNGTSEQTIANGLRYENFVWRNFNNIASDPGFEFPPGSGNFLGAGVYGDWQTQAPSNIGVRTDYDFVSGRPDCDVCFSEYYAAWPYANLLSVAPDEDTYSIGDGLSAFAMSFDVIANHPSLAIDRIGAFAAFGFNIGLVEAWTYVTVPAAAVEVTVFPYESGDPIATNMPIPGVLLGSLHTAPNWVDPVASENSVTFSPLERVTVHSFILVREGSTFGALTHEIRLTLVPEPTSSVMLLALLAVGLVCRREGFST